MGTKYKASAIQGSGAREESLGVYDTKEDAVARCAEYLCDWDDGDFMDEKGLAIEALHSRGYYCVGYSLLMLQVDEI